MKANAAKVNNMSLTSGNDGDIDGFPWSSIPALNAHEIRFAHRFALRFGMPFVRFSGRDANQ